MSVVQQIRHVLSPGSVAIVGASSNFSKFTGRTVKYILKHKYGGRIYPVNPKRDQIAGLACFPAVQDLPEPVDTVFIQIAAQAVPAVLEQCARKGIKSAIIHSADLGEAGEKGTERQRKIKALAQKTGMRIVGPNCAGIANMVANTILSPVVCYELDALQKGRIALVSQSGGLTGAYVSRADARGIGFSHVISTGNEMDLEACDFIQYLLHDEHTDVIALFLEGLRNVRRFHEVADMALEMGKPIVVLKVGRTSVGSKAAASHTGALTGADAVYDAVFRQKGVTRVDTLEDLLEVSALFCRVKPPQGNRVGVVTTTGGGATLIVEAGALAGLAYPRPSDAAVRQAAEFLPGFAAKSNPMDVTMSGAGGGFKQGVEVFLKDDAFDLVVGVVGTSSQFAPEMGVKPIVEVHAKAQKPLVAFCNPDAAEALRLFEKNGIPSFRTPESCGRALGHLVRRGIFLEKRKNGADFKSRQIEAASDHNAVKALLNASPRILNEYDSKKILAQYNIATTRERLAKDVAEAKKKAREIGYPLVLKVLSGDIAHKTEARAIKIGVDSPEALEKTFAQLMHNARNYRPDARIDGMLIQAMAPRGVEVIVGMSQDAQFGPTIMFGLGGVFVEVFKDVAFRVAPVSEAAAREMIDEIKGAVLLKGYRGMAKMDIDAIARTLVRVSQLSQDLQASIQEMDINPLVVFPEGSGVMAVDALIRKRCEKGEG